MKNLLPISLLALAASLAPVSAEAPASLLARQDKVSTVVNTSGKAVVGISGIGSGVIIDKEGTILTAAHVLDAFEDQPILMDGKETISIVLHDGKRVQAKILGRNRNRDAAMAKIVDKGEYIFAEMADPETLKQGDWCIAMGHPGGFQFDRTPPVRLGRLWEKADDKYHRTDCTVSGGDSGGPLFNLEGKIVGIHSSIGQRLEENRHVPIGAFKESWERLSKGEGWGNLGKLMPELERFDRPHSKDKAKPQSKPEARETPKPKSKPAPQMIPEAEQTLDRPDLGVALDPKSEAAAKVTSVRPDSPAEQAGFQEGDVIEKVDGAEISSPGAFIEAIQARKPGDSVKFSILRDGKDISLQAKLGRRSE